MFFHIREFEGGVDNCIHPIAHHHRHQTESEAITTQRRVNVLWHMTYASETSSSLYHLQRLPRPALMAGASDWYRSCSAICSQRVCSHSSRPTALVTVASVSLEKICCASVTSCSMVA